MSTYRQLKQQIAELEKKAAIAMKTEVRKVIESIRKQIAEFGLTAADLGLEVARRAGARKVGTARVVLKPKYRDPVSGRTWNGHGKRPAWIVAAQDKGKLEELLIEKASRSKAAQGIARPTAERELKKAVAPAKKPAASKPARKARAPAAKKRAASRTAPKKAAPTKAAAPAAPALAPVPEVAPPAA